jgi:hypothetical protein
MGLFDLLAIISSFFPVVAGLIIYTRLRKDMRRVLYFFIFVASYEILLAALSVYRRNNLMELNLFTLIETWLLVIIFSEYIREKKMKNSLIAAASAFTGLWIYINLVQNPLATFTVVDESVKCIMFLGFSAWLLFEIAREIQVPLFLNYRFWLIVAFLLYFSATFVLFTTSTWIFESTHHQAMYYTWLIHACITILTNSIATYSFICFYRQRNLYYL